MISRTQPENFNPKFEVVGCFIEHDGKVLLLQRHENKPEGNTWCIPGGKIDANETAAVTVAREIGEETGINISSDEFEYLTTVYTTFPTYQFVYHMFKLVLDDLPEIKISLGEHKDVMWATPDEALNANLIQDGDECFRIVYGIE